MLFKESWSSLADGTNVRWVKIFHLYKGFVRRSTTTSMFVKSSAQVVEPPQVVYKGTKFKYSVKGDIVRSVIVRVLRFSYNKAGFGIHFDQNCSVTIKKRQQPRSLYNYGPVSRFALRRTKMLALFKKVF